MGKKISKGTAGIVTGASSGIGKALALKLAAKYSARLVLSARGEGGLKETKQLVEEAGGQACLVVGDVADEKLQGQLVKSCLDNFKQIDLIVNNAGLAKPGKIVKLTPADWQYVFAVNFFAPLNITYLALPHLIANKAGKIVNISSVAGKIAFPGSVCYAASKFALTGMSEGMAAELAQNGIDVITVCPGWVRSEFFSKNNMSEGRNPTVIAQGNDLKGWLMRNVLSISSEQAADDILSALEKEGSSELVLTAPGILAERIAALFPSLMAALAKRTPLDYVDSSNRN
jgi:short-subunit dehydrogenase